MTEKRTTSTFTLDHERCDPSKWTVREWKLLADYMRTGELSYAAGLARLGFQLVLSDKHEATGGSLEPIGWARVETNGDLDRDEIADDLADLDIEYEVTDVCRIYRGLTVYAVPYDVGDESHVDMEIDVFDTLAAAEKFDAALKSGALQQEVP